MKNIYCLALESSCDETSASIVKNGTLAIATVVLSQIDIHTCYGGVVPEIASRKHIESITIVIEETLSKANMTINEIDCIAVTYGPGLIGSLLIGVEAAKTLAFIYNKPIVPVHHIAGHIYANNLEKRLEFPLIALVVSGGHTELIYMEKDYKFQKIGGTLDDAVGEAYDKVGRILDLTYPAGPKLDKMAVKGMDTYKLPTPLDDETYNFSFSGLKSAVINLKHNESQRNKEIDKCNLATSFQNRVINILTKKTIRAIKKYNVKNLIIAGGVAANLGLRNKLAELCYSNKINLILPKIENCTDNAAMIGAAGFYAYQLGKISSLNFNAKANDELK
ncbi:MAG: tRNA (adenosine(37)-N6)-threonylcarbamoyltransferase complex transferase subunit TsaD [Bacilli bacterium]